MIFISWEPLSSGLNRFANRFAEYGGILTHLRTHHNHAKSVPNSQREEEQSPWPRLFAGFGSLAVEILDTSHGGATMREDDSAL